MSAFLIGLSEDDRAQIEDLLAHLEPLASGDLTSLLGDLAVLAQELPRSLRSKVNRFRLEEPCGTCVIRGIDVDDDRIGPTPPSWNEQPDPASTAREDVFLLMCGSLLGDPIAWATQQDGRLVHDVIPIKGHEYEQINSSSQAALWWHTEDAFHPYRADYVGLMCLRNPDGAQTTYASFDDLRLPPETVRLLCESRYVIRPDESHLSKNRAVGTCLGLSAELLERSYAWIEQMREAPPLVPILFGDPDRPYGRLDPYFMDHIDDDPAAIAAFDALVKEIDDKITSAVLQPGDVFFIDNYKAVHGRKPYAARFDGRDRWLRRINVARDLRRSRSARIAPESRVIF